MNFEKKRALVRRVRLHMEARYDGRLHAVCHMWAAAVVDELAKLGQRAIIQAGTMMWPCVAVDDGVSPTHFSYVWEPNSPTTVMMLAQNLMPELHVWAAIPTSREIIDLTTGFLPTQAKLRAGIEWTGKRPPDHLWCPVQHRPPGVSYIPYPDATFLALDLIRREKER